MECATTRVILPYAVSQLGALKNGRCRDVDSDHDDINKRTFAVNGQRRYVGHRICGGWWLGGHSSDERFGGMGKLEPQEVGRQRGYLV